MVRWCSIFYRTYSLSGVRALLVCIPYLKRKDPVSLTHVFCLFFVYRLPTVLPLFVMLKTNLTLPLDKGFTVMSWFLLEDHSPRSRLFVYILVSRHELTTAMQRL